MTELIDNAIPALPPAVARALVKYLDEQWAMWPGDVVRLYDIAAAGRERGSRFGARLRMFLHTELGVELRNEARWADLDAELTDQQLDTHMEAWMRLLAIPHEGGKPTCPT